MKILIMGLPNAGKTTLATHLTDVLNAVHLNADEIRREIHKDLGFSVEDRVEHARRLGVLADIIGRNGSDVIADFVCPTKQTREAFNPDFIVFVDHVADKQYADTYSLFETPTIYDVRTHRGESPLFWAGYIYEFILDKKARTKHNGRSLN